MFENNEIPYLSELLKIQDSKELESYRIIVNNKLIEAKKNWQLYQYYGKNREKLSVAEKIAFSELQQKFPRLENLENYIKQLEKYSETIATRLEGRKQNQPKKEKNHPHNIGKVSNIVAQYEVKIVSDIVTVKSVSTPTLQLVKGKSTNHLKPILTAFASEVQLHENIERSDLREGSLLTNIEVEAVKAAVARAKTTGQALVKIKRTRGREGEAFDKLSELEKTLHLNYSVIVIPDKKQTKEDTLIALYKGKAQALGIGQYGVVKLGQLLGSQENEWVAVKIEKVPKEPKSDLKRTTETQILRKTGSLKGEVVDSTKSEKDSKQYTVQVLLKGHSLDYYFSRDNAARVKKDQEKGVNSLITDLAVKLDICISSLENLKNLHALNILHRDLHPGNIMFDPLSKQTTLIDFGSAAELGPNESSVKSEPVGLYDRNRAELQTPEAVEHVKRTGSFRGLTLEYSTRTDINSMGYTIASIISNFKDPEIVENFPAEFNEPISNIIDRMVNQNQSESVPSLEECIAEFRKIKRDYTQSLEMKGRTP